MSTPQNPGDGDTPQDPSDPQNPYGTPPPPAPTPYGEPAPPPVAPSSPSPYGEQPPPSAVPPAAPPYGQPGAVGVPGQPAYGAPSYPSPMPGPAEPGKGMAITALVLSILGCTCIAILVAIPLAIVALVRSRGGKNAGKGMAIAALVISVVYIIAWVVGGYLLYDWAKDLKTVDDLKTGQCITAKNISKTDDSGITEIKVVSCSTAHDAEVLATGNLTMAQADSFDSSACDDAIMTAGKAELIVPPLTYNGLAAADSEAGDKFVCVAYNTDGSKLTSRIGS